MSILTKPYEISVWDDVWDGAKFVEKRLGVIGSSAMNAQCRVFSPNLTQKTNGTKELSFQLYKRYIDNITGKEVSNPFYDWLVNERKVKLQYDGKWYDFIIKNIQENSSTYQYTYKLEDALVQELSKNGFSAEFDDSLMNNSGTANELAERVLVETDWEVSENSEAFVEGIEEALIYLRTESALKAYQVIDQDANNLKEGVTVSSNEVTIPEGKTILAFYSSCADKPYRFQFIYVDNLTELTKDDNRLITNKNCQYFIDNPEYGKATEPNGFYLPNGLNTTTVENEIVSGDYRAKRYGFAQESIFVPVLNRYVNVYKKDGKEYYGYLNTNYVSPTLVQNYISNTQFKNTSGWTGTRFIAGAQAKVENVIGRFYGSDFINVLDEVDKMSGNTYSAYMKLSFGEANSLVLNSGPRDNRTSIGRIEDGEEWALVYKAYDKSGNSVTLNFDLAEYIYVSQRDSNYNFYEENTTNRKLHFTKEVTTSPDASVNVLFTAIHDGKNSDLTEKWFKKNSEIRLAITAAEGDYYIESISLFKVVRDDDGNIILPEKQAETIASQVIDTNYYFFAKEDIEGITNEDELAAPIVLKELDYKQFVPTMIEGAQKVRTIQGKESNYFNLLQSIAEKFEAWLDFEITRDEYGAVLEKKVVFRNYLGKTNHVGFKYGVNLKDIQRTFESKQIVTKLIVKDNSNEFANNGFCSIAKASANPTGENYIYDFQYFFNRGMLSAEDYLNTLYVYDGASGSDIQDGGEFNLKGYFPRIKAINQKIDKKNEIIINLSKDITALSAKLQVAQAGYEAAQGGIEQCNYDFQATVPTPDSIPEHSLEEGVAERTDVKKILREYITYKFESDKYALESETLEKELSKIQQEYNTLLAEVKKLGEWKAELNKLFFSVYSRYIQEGTWVEESYVDDNKYYADALSTMYNSCYPKASYTINVLNISKLPGYEGLSYELGDKTFIEDKDFFGDDSRVEIVVTEVSENLDDPSQDKIKVQTFKNQFQDLFQKITASVQSAQLSEGSYEKAVALAEAGQERKNEFVTDALAGAGARLQLAGQQSVTYGDDGLTIVDVDSPSNSIRMIGGAILLSKQDKNGQTKWTTGLTSDGITADLITAGILNVGEISIMNHDEPVFRWDSFGISAFDAVWADAQGTPVISSINTDKFVRFDKHGIYGINGDVNGMNWHPTGMDEINDLATFSLTWDGLHVTHGDASVHIGLQKKGKDVESLISIYNKDKKNTLSIDANGNIDMTGTITANAGRIGGKTGWEIDGASLRSSINTNNQKGSIHFNSAGNSDSDYWISAHDGPSETNVIKFSVSKNGLLYAQNATIEGDITATSGTIGGWVLDEDYLKSNTDKLYLFGNEDGTAEEEAPISVFNGGAISNLVIRAGSDTTAKFGVDKNGTLYAAEAQISGKINATAGEIGGCKINDGKLEVPTANITGTLTANSVSVKDASGNNLLKAGNNEVILSDDWYFFSKSMRYKDRALGAANSFVIYPSGNTTTTTTIAGVARSGWKLGIGTGFGVAGNGTLYATGADISGTITADHGRIGAWDITTYTEDRIGTYSSLSSLSEDGVHTHLHTHGLSVSAAGSWCRIRGDNDLGPDVNFQFYHQNGLAVTMKEAEFSSILGETKMGMDNIGILLEVPDENNLSAFHKLEITSTGGKLSGTWKGTSSHSITSDLQAKHSITALPTNYEILFDHLRPIRYKYNDGRSNRYHTGFIAQDIEQALIIAELTTQDFAAYVFSPSDNIRSLRYEEFIALNTHEIQKLKPRMTAAEQEITKLKLEVESLRTELQNLQNSQNSAII